MKNKDLLTSKKLRKAFLAASILMLLVSLAIAGGYSGYGRAMMGWLGMQVETESSASAANSADGHATQNTPGKLTPPPKSEDEDGVDAACSLIITNVSVGECRNDAVTGNQPKVLVAVFVSWTDPPVGQSIEITIDGTTKTINPTVGGCEPYVQFIIDADGSTLSADAQFSGGTCTAPSVLFNVPSPCFGADPCTGPTAIGGTVYSDFDSDGTKDPSEFGLEGAQIDIFDNAENLLCTTTSDFQGRWSCTSLTAGQAVRVEISNYPTGFTAGGVGPDNFGGVVQFATVGSNCTVDFGLLNVGKYCENNPFVVTPLYFRGDPLAGGSSGDRPALVAIPYTASGEAALNIDLAQTSEIGSTWGVAFQKETKTIFSSAFLKRHVGWGPGGLGAIYRTDISVMPPPSPTGNASLYFNLDSYGINTGNEASLTRSLGPNVNTPTYDGQVFDLVGKWGLGDLDISEDGDSLFIVNLYNRSVIIAAIGNPAIYPVPGSAITEVPIPDPGCSGTGDWRPFALKYNNGKLYIGGVCSAQTSQNTDDLNATVYEFDPGFGTFTEILMIPLDYTKGVVLTGLSHCTNWNPWTNDFSDLPAGGIELCYPQPMLSDIEFDVYGNMLLAFNDRAGHQMGWYDYGTTPPSTSTWKGNAGGDILRVINNNGTWLIERNGTAGYDTGCGIGTNQGPCGGEFYCQDSYLSAHQEAVHGGIALHPSNNELLLNMMDPTSAFSGGLAWYNNATGVKNRAYRVYFSGNDGSTGLSGKASGLGDVEILCGEAPIELGNYVWVDTDNDGIQDPGEPALQGVNVALYKGNTLLASTTTDANGHYKFTLANGLLPNMDYCIGFGTGGQASSGVVSVGGTSYILTQQNIGFGANNDNNDSDAQIGDASLPAALQGVPVICVTTGNRGDNDNTLDAGFFPVADYGDLPDNNLAGSYPTDGINGAGEGIGASHQILPTLKMGATVDFEPGGQASTLANGDDSNGAPDDEDGVALPTFIAGQSATIPVTVMNMSGSAARLYGFFDWNKDGDFLDAGEATFVNVPNNTNGVVNLSIPVPLSAIRNMDLGARFRLSTSTTLTAVGPAPNGEVEDYLIQVVSYDWGDLPDSGPGTGMGDYQVLASDNGPYHLVVDGLKIGATVDFEGDGQPSALANGDGADEDGVASFPQLGAGQLAQIQVNVMNMTSQAAILYAYYDWNKDGDFEDANEQSSVGVPIGTNGPVLINAYVPSDVTVNMPLGVRFRLSTDVAAAASPEGFAPDGEVEDYLVEVISIDYGDLPAPYATILPAGPSHVVVDGIKLGATVDGEPDGQPDNQADGDDDDGTPDDEDGVALPMFVAGQLATVPVNYMNMTALPAKITLFFDWNANGNFLDPGEMVSVNVNANTSGITNFSVPVPAGATLNADLGVRARISTDMGASMSPNGPAPDGEVEDYLTQVMAFDWADLADTGPGTGPGNYQTLASDNGPNHKIVTGIKLGASVDAESDGQPNGTATGDGADENGIAAFPVFTAGETAQVTVSVMNMAGNAAVVYGFFDWNGDGDFEDTDEKYDVAVPDGFNGTIAMTVQVPDDVLINTMLGARFRLSTDANSAGTPEGASMDGEVEDYLVMAIGYDYGDLADDDAPGSYPTNETDGGEGVGACHQIVPGLKIGSSVDNEVAADPNPAAQGDDINGADDENGIASFPTFTAGQNATVSVNVMNMMTPPSAAYLYGFIDWNKDGDFNDPNETATVSVPNGTNGNVNLTFSVPENAVLNMDLGARFRLSTQSALGATGCVPDGEVEDYYVLATGVDYGDLPDDNTAGSYPTDDTNGAGEGVGACHTIVTGLKIGSEVSPETAALPDANADGDDANGPDDEDGIVEFPMFVAGQSASVSVYVMNMLSSGDDATLYGFIDWNGDGDFNDAGETATAFVQNGVNGNVNLVFDVPIDAETAELVGARFRLSTQAGLGATGCAPDGEVEDYLVMVNAVDYGDLPDDNTAGSYPTDPVNGTGEGVGACHTIVTGLKIGSTVDGEAGGTPSSGANADDNTGDDEDGISMFPMFYAGQQATVAVNVMNMLTNGASATLYGFIDWNQDGDFLDANEAVTAFVANGTNGAVNLTFDVPLGAVINDDLGARFRLSTEEGLGATGCAPDGEVEDYIVMAGAIDFGDLPDNDQPGSYPTNPTDGAGEGEGACHQIVEGLKIGSSVDPEGAALPDDEANGDDSNPIAGNDDEDGVASFPMFLAGQSATVEVLVMNMIQDGPTAYLYGFADWNKDGDFEDTGESVSVPVPNGTNGTVNLTFNVPAGAVLNMEQGFRLRISTDSQLEATGCAPDGEVEDYLITVMAFDYGDLADNDAAGSYPTNSTDGAGEGVGPSHKIVDGLKLGASVDFEDDGQPSANADGDGADENGIASFPAFEAGAPAVITVNVMDMTDDPAALYGFIDWNKDGDFNDPDEIFNVTVPVGFSGDVVMNVNVPEDAVINMPLGARFRLSTDDLAASTPEGPAPDGEVEDYLVSVVAYDYGDLTDNDTPNSFPTNNFDGGEGAGAKHRIIETLYMGALVDAETDGQPSEKADGDDQGDSPDDEDGVVFLTPLVPGYTACLEITTHNATGASARLQAWMDFNGNGQFDSGEMLTSGDFSATGALIPTGDVTDEYCFTVPAGATFNGGILSARFRLSTAGGLGYSGTAPDGEVEDYILPLAKIGNLVWDDTNGNGLQDEPGSAGINGVTVELVYAGPDGDLNTVADNETYSAVTSTMAVDGQYMFVGLVPGVYEVNVPTNPAGFNVTGVDEGNDEIDSDDPAGVVVTIPDPVLLPLSEDGTGDVPGLVFPDAQDNLTLDFGFYRPAAIGDYVWVDDNGNGVQDPGEDPLEGVTVRLTGTDALGNPVDLTDVTDVNGEYLFDNLVPGEYKVTFPVSFGNYVITDLNEGGNDADDSDGDPDMDGMSVFEILTSGDTIPTYDAGFYEPAEIGNYTWIDENANGIQDPGEDPLPGVTVILTGTTGAGEPVNQTALTDANGLYWFTGLQPGEYKLTFQTPLGGYVSTEANDPDANDTNDSDAIPSMGGMTEVEVLTSGESNPTYDAGYYQPASIGNFVWEDKDADGEQDPGEPGIQGVEVSLTGVDGQGNPVNLTTTTDIDGSYLFDNLMPGSYKLTFGEPTGMVTSPVDQAGGDDTQDSDADPNTGMTVFETLVSGEHNPDYDAGYFFPVRVGDYVWLDDNANGVQDAGETGLENVEVKLLDGSGNPVQADAEGNAIVNQFTDADGYYLFDNLTPGTYMVMFINPDPSKYTLTAEDAGTDDALDSDPDDVNLMTDPTSFLESGEEDLTLDAGFFVKAKVGDFVWEDVNGDGIQNDGPTGIGGVEVTLTGTDNQGNPVNLTTTTDGTGMYMFGDLIPGEYKITFGTPGGDFVPTDADQGSDDGLDSDFGPMGMTPVFTVVSGDTIPTFDAGFYEPAEIGNYTWIDEDADGIQDPGEEPLPGVTVILTGTTGSGEPVNQTALTDANGLYLFDNLQPGTYKLTFQTPVGGYLSTTANDPDATDATDSDADPAMGGMTVEEVLVSGESNLTYDAGYYLPASIGDYLWSDLDADGVQDTGEPGIVNAPVTLDGIDGQGNVVHLTTTTDASGYYLFDNLVPGSYKLTFGTPAGFDYTSPLDAGGDDAYDSDANPGMGGMTVFETLVSGEHNPDYDAGFYACPEISVKDLPVQPVCPEEEVDAIQLFTMPGAAWISWSGGASIGLADGSGPGPMQEIPAFVATEEGSPTITVTATLGECVITYEFVITVDDSVEPVFVNCPEDLVVYNDIDQCGAIVSWPDPVAIDNCEFDPVVTLNPASPTSGTFLEVGTVYTVTYTADDTNGNTSICEFTIEVLDVQLPAIECPYAFETVGTNLGNCSYTIEGLEMDAVASDNCPDWTLVNDYDNTSSLQGSVLPLGETTIVWTVTDASDNVSSCTMVITVVDDDDPTVDTCPEDITVENDPGVCGAVVEYTVLFDDNCDGQDLTGELIYGLYSGETFPVGTTEVKWHYTDAAGNGPAVCEFTVTVLDTEQPTIECPRDIVIDINASGYATVTEGSANIYSQGPCGVTLTYEPPVADDNCDWIMTNYAGLGAIDNFTVQGFGSYFSAENWDISADGDGFVYTGAAPLSVLLQGANDGTNDAQTRMCITMPVDGTMSFDWYYESQDWTPFYDPFGYELDGVFYELTDPNGPLVQNGQVTINVESGQEFCFVQTSTDGIVGPGVTITNLFVFEDVNTPNPQYYEYGGVYTEGWQVVDASGNQTICNFTITIDDAQPPTITCPNNIVVESAPAICGAAVMYAYPLGIDNCPDWYVIQLQGPGPGQVFPLGNTTVEYQITDNNGNVTTCNFQVRVVDGEAPTFFECAPDQNIYTSDNGTGDCCSIIPRLTDDVVIGDNCADTELPTVALFYDPDYTDTAANCDGEAYNVYQHLINRGFSVVLIDRLEDYGQWSAALGAANILVIPALEGNSNFLADMPVGSVDLLLQSFVNNNGGRILMMAGGSGSNAAANVMNSLYGYSLTEDCCYNGNTSYLNQPNALYTSFYTGPASIGHHFSTRTINGIPGVNAKSIYEMSTNSDATVAWFSKGSGEIVYFGWSFRNGGPLCADADTEFTEVLDRALLELAGEGIIVTQSPEAYSTYCGQHGDEIEVVISAIDFDGNESSCTTIVTLLDDEKPVIFPPAPITVDCGDISETADPSATIIDWLAEAYATDNCDAEPMLTYDFDITTLDICADQTYTITVTWTAVDDAGNVETATSTITVVPDTEDPFLSVPDPITLDCGDISETVDPAALIDAWLAEAYATDNCDTDPVLTHSFDGSVLDICALETYTITVTWTAKDACDNTTVLSSTITVVPDTEDPFLYVPDPITLDCGDISETNDPAAIIDAWLAQAYAADNCDTDPTLSHSFEGGQLDICADEPYTITVTWTAQDACYNATILSSTITIVPDTEDPYLYVPAPITLDCGDISETSDPAALIDAWLAEAYTTDNCDTDPELAYSFNGSVLDVCADETYTITVTWTANDACGNTTVLSSTITVVPDTEDPYLFVPAPITLDCGDISETADPAALIDAWLAEAYTTDNCDTDPELAYSFNGSVLDVCADETYTITVTWTANDACGNTTVLSSTITVVPDTEDPYLFVPSPITLDCGDISETADPAALIDAWLAEAYTTDNCDTDPELAHDFSGAVLDICADETYTITVTWTANDACGNTTVLSSTITVVPDTQAPDLFVPAPITLDCGDISETSDPAALIDAWLAEAYTTDNCDTDPELAHDFSGAVLDICADETYTITVTWTANDACGNTTVLSSTITVVPDTQAPDLFVPAPITLDCGDISETADPAALIDAWLAEAYTTDNCDTDPTLSHSFNGATLDVCADEAYTITVTWTAADACGNTTVLSSTITVVPDTEAPVITTPDPLVLDCDDISETTDPSAAIDAWLAEAYATDNCDTDPELTYDFDITTLDVCVGGTLTVTWTSNDACGNTSTATSTITVIPDTDAPVFVECPTGYTFNNDVDKCGANVTWAVPVAEDACTADVVVTQTGGPAQGSFLEVGVIYMVEYTATDGCGNTAICTFPVQVVDMQNPVAICQDVVVYLDPIDGEASITAADVDGGSYDNCGIVSWTISEDFFTCDNVGENNVTLTVTDAAGNSEVCVAEVSVIDNTAPTFTCPDPALVSGCDEIVPDLVSLVTDAFDNCGVEYIYQNPVAGTDFGNQSGQSIIVTIIVTDVNGNVATCEVEVTIDDTVAPVFVNCPTEMIMIGNDPDECSGKLNWSIPVATDNCELESIIQISGPAVGSVVPVCQPMTVVYEAEDAVGNTSQCSFQVLVIDTQDPEVDLDIVMPGNITVQCDAVPAPFVLTNDDVNDNCTAPEDLVIQFTQTSTQDPNQFNCGHYNYTITRTWTITDETCIYGGGGNVTTHVQVITVVDTQAPTALCKNITVELDKFGQATITGLMINDGSSDNCAPAFTLTYEADPNTFDCSNLGENEVTLTVTDPCGNSATCTAIVTVVEGIAPCVPEYAVSTTCLDNATTLNDGQFAEIITVKSLAGQTWTVASSTGLFTNNSPAPPAAPIAVANGTAFTMGSADGIDNDGNGSIDEAEEMIYYTLRAKFVEGAGYTATVQNNLGTTGTISNKAYYPTPVFVDLFDPFCLTTPPFPILVEDFYGGEGTVIEVLIDGEPNNIFNAEELGEGPHTIKVTFDAGTQQNYTVINGVVVDGSDAEALADPGCIQMISTVVNVVGTPSVVACNDTIQVSLEGNCVSEITPDMILEGTYYCYDDYSVVIDYPWNTTQFDPPTQVDASHVGQTLSVQLWHAISGNMCWATIVVEDKWKPEITCPDNVQIFCTQDPDDLDVVGEPYAFDCSDFELDYADIFEQFSCAENSLIKTRVTRTWIANDEYNNSNSCTQVIEILRGSFDQIVMPASQTFSCTAVPNAHPDYTGWPQLAGVDLTDQGNAGCGVSVVYEDQVFTLCAGSYEVSRTWTIKDFCTASGGTETMVYTQSILIEDEAPTVSFASQAWNYDPVNDWYLISANSWSPQPNLGCVATGPLPLAIIDGVCNEVVEVTVSTPLGNTTNGGLLPAPGLPIGQHQITYFVQDQCDNITSVTIVINVIDNIVPVAICDEITDVTLSSDGLAVVNATTFDDGSYDNCCLAYFEARRMDGDCEGNYDDLGPTVTFCCTDAGQSVMVVFRAYDCYGNFNECMVSVNVNDKVPPIIISCPAPQTITCDDYLTNLAAAIANEDYSVLEQYGEPLFYDNCQLDVTYTVTENIDNCSAGTVTRSWTATDGTNVPVTCTQTITVQHVSDWVVEFPADVTVECTDGQLPDTGEPEIFFDECELIAVSYEDQTFTVVPDACYKIERVWTIINWCVYEEFGSNLYSEANYAESNLNVDWDGDGDKDSRTFRDGFNSSGTPGVADGYISFKQVIKVTDTEDPAFEVPAIDGCIVEADCDKDLVLPFPTITDECSIEYDVDITGDFGDFNDISGDVTVPNVGVGEYEVTYAVTDNCGNTGYQTITITVEDCKKPTPLCDNGLVVEIMQTQMVTVNAEAFDEGSFDNCGPIAHFSYSSDITDTEQTFDCEDVAAGQVQVQIWVTDIYGNQDYCETFLQVQDNMGFCGGTQITIAGEIATEEEETVEGVTVEMNGGLLTQITGLDGQYGFNVVAGNDYTVTPMLDENAANGVTTYDMVLITRHILNVDLLNSPYKIIAADANKSGTVTTLDLVAIRKVILVVEDDFPNNTSWRFVDNDFVFPNPLNPWQTQFFEVINYNNLQASDLEADFVAVKIGDVNGSAATSLDGQADQRTMMGDLLFHAKDMKLKAGQTYTVPFYGDDQTVFGYQFTMELGEGIELLDVTNGVAAEENFGFALLEEGALTTSWNEADARRLGSEEAIFTLVLKAKYNTTLSEELSTSSRYTMAEAYGANGELLNVQLTFGNEVAAGFELYQNIPNPFTGITRIGFRLPEATNATLTITDAAGKVVRVVKGEYARGYNEVNLSDFGGVSGVLYYRLDTPTHSATRKMVILE
jgi:hypothetical protein